MEEKKTVDDIIAMLDDSVANGVGHLNIFVEQEDGQFVDVEQMGVWDCSKNNMACNVPTLHEGIDEF